MSTTGQYVGDALISVFEKLFALKDHTQTEKNNDIYGCCAAALHVYKQTHPPQKGKPVFIN